MADQRRLHNALFVDQTQHISGVVGKKVYAFSGLSLRPRPRADRAPATDSGTQFGRNQTVKTMCIGRRARQHDQRRFAARMLQIVNRDTVYVCKFCPWFS